MAYTGPLWRASRSLASGGANLSLPMTSFTHSAGDTLFVLVCTDGQAATTSSDYSVVASASYGTTGGADGLGVYLFRKNTASVGSASEPNFVGVAPTGGGVGLLAFAIQGFTYVDVTATSTSAASTSVSWPSVTTSGNNRLILNLLGDPRDATGARLSAATNASLATVTERVDTGFTAGLGGGLAIVSGHLETAGSTGSTTGTLVSAEQGLITVALTYDAPTAPSTRRAPRHSYWL